MKRKKLSLSIPYKQRLDNLAIVFEALAKQTMDKLEFEVIVGAMEYCQKYVDLCKRFIDHINIISVMSAEEFSIPRARNLAMRQASGLVVVQMDADTLLPPTALQNLYNNHFLFSQNICVVGQVVGYGNNKDGSLTSVETQGYSKYKQAFVDLEKSKGKPKDPRFQTNLVVPWAFGWTGLIALPLATVQKHQLYFDENFHGWGTDDLEWSYRISKTGTPIVLCEDVYAIHLPHYRDAEANEKTGKVNFDRFLAKWPSYDVELAHIFGDFEANSLYISLLDKIQKVTGNKGHKLGTVRGKIKSIDTLLIGVIIDDEHCIIDEGTKCLFDEICAVEILPLLGMALPYSKNTVSQCDILPLIAHLGAPYSEAVTNEAKRISKKVILRDSSNHDIYEIITSL